MSTDKKPFLISELINKPALFIESVWFEPDDRMKLYHDHDIGKMNLSFKPLSKRALFMAKKEDTVVIDSALSESEIRFLSEIDQLPEILIPARSVKKSLVEDIIEDSSLLEKLKSLDCHIESYIPASINEKLELARDINSYDYKRNQLLNNKIIFDKILDSTSLLKIESFIGNRNSAHHRLINSEPPLVIKARGSIGGSRVYFANSKAEINKLAKLISKSPPFESFILQPAIKVKKSFNLQIYIDDNSSHIFSISEQILNESKHIGNLFFPKLEKELFEKIINATKELLTEAILFSHRSVLGIDFILDVNDNLYPVEFNARHNTSTYAVWYINRLFNQSAVDMIESDNTAQIRIDFSANLDPSFLFEKLGQDLFNLKTRRGIIPLPPVSKSVTFVIIGEDSESRDHLIAKLQRLPVTL